MRKFLPYNDYYLRFADRAEAESVLVTAGVASYEDQPKIDPQTGEFELDPDTGEVVTEQVFVPGATRPVYRTLEVRDKETGELVEERNGELDHVRAAVVDMIGPMVTTPGTYDPETGAEITPPVWDNRYHVNVRANVPPNQLQQGFLNQYKITPATPKRKFA